jgi:nicotinate dehydrogenase subunit A
MTMNLNVNGQEHIVDTDPATPLLYVLREDLRLNAAKFGCGMGPCGACRVVGDSRAVFSFVADRGVPRKVVTVEGLGSAEKPAH